MTDRAFHGAWITSLLALVLGSAFAHGASEARTEKPESRLWRRLIVESGSRGQFFNPNLPEVKLAKGIGLEKEGRHYVFAAYPDTAAPGRARVLLVDSNCDFLRTIREGRRGGCSDYEAATFMATDSGTLTEAFHAADGSSGPLSPTDPEVRTRFLSAKNLWLDYAKGLGEVEARGFAAAGDRGESLASLRALSLLPMVPSVTFSRQGMPPAAAPPGLSRSSD